MGLIIDLMERMKTKRETKKDRPDSIYDAASGEAETSGNPITDLYNRAVTHPATTIGLIAGAVGIGAALAFVLAEQRAQKGIDREVARKARRLLHFSDEEIAPRIKQYRRKYRKRLPRWMR